MRKPIVAFIAGLLALVTLAATVGPYGVLVNIPFNGNPNQVVLGNGTVGNVPGGGGGSAPTNTITGNVTANVVPKGSNSTNLVDGPQLVSSGTNVATAGGLTANYVTSTNVVTGSSFTATGTGADQLPSGTTAQQPSNAAGLIRWNTDTARLELNIGSGWKNLVRLDGDTMTGNILFTDNTYNIGASGATRPANAYLSSGLFVQKDALGSLTLPGLVATNSTSSTSGVTLQYSPALFFSGHAWHSGGSFDVSAIYRQYMSVTSGSPPVSYMTWDSSIAGASFANQSTLSSLGNLYIGNSIACSTSGTIGPNQKSTMSSSVDGKIEFNNSAGSSRATAQANQPSLTKTANYTIVALDSGQRFNNIGAVAAATNTLPTAVANMHIWAHVDAAQILSMKASGSDKIQWGSTLSGAAGDIWSSQVGSTLHLFAPKALLWVVDEYEGAWTLVAARSGNATLVGGTVTVNNATVTANTIVMLTRKTSGGTIGTAITYTTSAATSFTINSDNILDTSTFSWRLEEIPN